MKYMILKSFVAVVLLLLSAMAQADETNLVPNPSVEQPAGQDPQRPEGWTTNSWGNVTANFTWAQGGISGTRSLRTEVLSGTEGDAKWWSDPFPLTNTKYIYTASVSYKSNTKSSFIIQALGEGEDNTAWLFPQEVVQPSQQWNTTSGVVEFPHWATRARIGMALPNIGWLETDDFALVEGAQQPDQDIISPPDDVTSPGDIDMPPGWKPPLVSIVFDDGWVSAVEQAAPIMESYGFRGTWFIVADFVDKPGYQADHATSKLLDDIAERGHEIASHSWDHSNLATLDREQVEWQLVESKKRLEEFGWPVAGLAPPGGLLRPEDLDLVKNSYSYSRTIDEGVNSKPYDTYGLKSVSFLSTTTPGTLKYWIEQAGLTESWLIVVFHRMAPEAQYETFVTPQQFQEAMELIAESGAVVRPIGEILGYWSPPEPQEPVGDKSFPPVTLDGTGWFGEDESEPRPPKESSGCSSQVSTIPGTQTIWMLLALLAGIWAVRRSYGR